MSFLYWVTPSALSDFRLRRLTSALQIAMPVLQQLKAWQVYHLQTSIPLTDDAIVRLQKLLGVRDIHATIGAPAVWVFPRMGTQSPWSTKATNILKECGLTSVIRVERGMAYVLSGVDVTAFPISAFEALYDRMTESLSFSSPTEIASLQAAPVVEISLNDDPRLALHAANTQYGFALAAMDIDYLADAYISLGRNPTDVELMMFAQVNSEHCRHKIFKARWTIDGQPMPHSLFDMIRFTYKTTPAHVLSAYSDNAAVIENATAHRFFADPMTHQYQGVTESVATVIKVETHNHPTAISPYAGAATGAGGEIRDEGATGRGAKPKAGLTGFSVSHLRIPGYEQPWELPIQTPAHIATPLQIMTDGPLGAAAFNNEFGRPSLCGYFRTYEFPISETVRWGYHKPIMIAGGLGNIRLDHVQKNRLEPGMPLIVLGGPAMRIGLGGGAASSRVSDEGSIALDFASVQRDNAEMQRRCQEVIDTCWALGDANPIVSIHDVGAGGLSNALPELVNDSARGGVFQLRAIQSTDASLSPLEIWCNEAQERYVLAIHATDLQKWEAICRRERCPYVVVGTVTETPVLKVEDALLDNAPVDIPFSLLFGQTAAIHRTAETVVSNFSPVDATVLSVADAVDRILQYPAVADKSFLITIGDRSVGGLVSRDPMIGPKQVPVADCAVTLLDHIGYAGEAMSVGERAPVAVIDPAAAAQLAVAEAIMNLAGAPIEHMQRIKLSANWMAAAGEPGQDAALYAAVRAIGMELCPALGLTIPVGKDSLSMKTQWKSQEKTLQVTSPVSCVISAFAPVTDVRAVVTPLLEDMPHALYLVDLSAGNSRMGGSVFAQVTQQIGHETPQVDADRLSSFFTLMQTLRQENILRAYHDRSDGGLFVTLLEMAFASSRGLEITLDALPSGIPSQALLFNEEVGGVIQVALADQTRLEALFMAAGLTETLYMIGRAVPGQNVAILHEGKTCFHGDRLVLHAQWSRMSHHIQALRDDPTCAQQAFDALQDTADPAEQVYVPFAIAPTILQNVKPKVAILREQGTNSQIEMAAAFVRAGFDAVDVSMQDLLDQQANLSGFQMLAICGGFSYGDVLGAGQGWAKSILFNDALRNQFSTFFERKNTLTLGVCNGCQMLSALKEIIPGAAAWPTFVRNRSEQFEARLVYTQITKGPSILLKGMEGARLPIVTSHGEGRAYFANPIPDALIALQYIDHQGQVTMQYPANPNGSIQGIAGMTTPDGRCTIIMPHPERSARTVQLSWHPPQWGEESPWMQLFKNAHQWIKDHA